MRRLFAAAVVTVGACAPGVHVRTSTAPDATFTRDRTFRFLPVPAVNRAVRIEITRALEERGYRAASPTADLSIAYYVGTTSRFSARSDDRVEEFMGLPWGWWPEREVLVSDRGTVIIDIFDGSGLHLEWRGTGTSDFPDDPVDSAAAVGRLAHRIMHDFLGYPTGEPWPRPVAISSCTICPPF